MRLADKTCKSRIDLIACDLDGTIVRTDGTISSRTLAALKACDRAGIMVVFVTGRPVRWMAPIIELTNRTGIAICSNGAVIVDLSTFDIIEVYPLSVDAVIECMERLRRVLPPVIFAADTLCGYGGEPGYFKGRHPSRGSVIGSLSAVLSNGPPPIKLLCRLSFHTSIPAIRADRMLVLAKQALAGVAEPVHSNPSGTVIEISARGVSKASAHARFADSVGIIPECVAAFGDMPNDIPMLRWAGHGYAMSDGHADVMAVAAHLAPPCQEDGVAQVIEQMLAEER